MERYRPYLKWGGRLAVLYGALLLASWVLMTVGLGGRAYDVTAATATKLFEIYANPWAALAARVEVVAAVVLAPALPALALYLARRTPGLAWSGLALGALATVTAFLGYLLETPAFMLGAAASAPPLLAALPPSDLILLFDLLGDAVTMPAMVLYYPWMVVWGVALFKAGGKLSLAAAVCAFGVPAFAVVTFGAFGARLGWLAGAGVFLQTAAEALAFALAGAAAIRETKGT